MLNNIKLRLKCFGHHDWAIFVKPVTFESVSRTCKICGVKEEAKLVWVRSK